MPREFDLRFQDLVERGERHEAEILNGFRGQGWNVAVISADLRDSVDAFEQTVAALTSRVDVVYQGVLMQESGSTAPSLLGRPDFLVRADLIPVPDGDPRPDGGKYEVVDAKLARSVKARAVLQSAFYSALLANVQGDAPRWMHLALGQDELSSIKVSEFAAYERHIRQRLVDFADLDQGVYPFADPYPDPVEHCAICRWNPVCSARRRVDDDLSLVAGITRRQRQDLKAAGIATRRGLASCTPPPELPRVGIESLVRVQQQAQLQVRSEDEGRVVYELLDPEVADDGTIVPNRGLCGLPEPASGDLFFDIEGSRYYSDDGKEFGLQYLFGIVDTAERDAFGRPLYRAFWAFSRTDEKWAFEKVIDFITERRRTHPGCHVYHYNHYEPTSMDHLSELHETRTEALGRLMGRYATREDEVDELFRQGAFVDLYKVIRQGVRVGVESYSIKRLEPLCGYQREVDLDEATRNLIAFEATLEGGDASSSSGNQAVIAGYNEDDCRATLVLREWLEERRNELAERLGEPLPRPAPPVETASNDDPDVERVKQELLEGVPEEAEVRDPDQKAKALLADLLGWHRRENKPAWWRYFYVRTLSDAELLGEPDAIAGLEGGDVVQRVKRSVIRRYRFPPQEHRFSTGDEAFDPVNERGWTIWALDDELGVLDLKIGNTYAGRLPTALVEGAPFDTRVLAQSLLALGKRVVFGGLAGPDAATALLMRKRPAGIGLAGGGLIRPEESASQASVRLALSQQGSYLAIQGPPGTGKTSTAAKQIAALVNEGRSVGITGPSHAVIHNLVDSLLRHSSESGETIGVGQRADEGNPFLHDGATQMSYQEIESALHAGDIQVAAGTPWMWAREQFEEAVDTLFVDEAGQMSLANVLSIARAGRNLILLGDPQQLAQPSQAAHPPGAGVSALEHVLGERATMPGELGLFMDVTWRMHPELCSFTSDVFYDGRLGWSKGLELQTVLSGAPPRGSGLRIVEVPHSGNTSDSPEEGRAVSDMIRVLLEATWRDRDGVEHPVHPNDILVVTPYNAQIREIEDALEERGIYQVRVGTVDKFQGRQAPVVIYSMATSSAEEAPRGMDFLYDPHRLNVATSRAKALAVIVASPEIPRAWCTTPRQMRLINTICCAWEHGQMPRSLEG